MAVLFITHKFPPSVGGMQKQSYELINGVRNHTKTYTIAKSPAENKLWFFLTLIIRIIKIIKRHKDISVIHCNDGVVASYCALFLHTNLPITATFHGLDIVYPGFFFKKFIIPRLQKLEKAFTVSEATRIECIARGFDPSKIEVIHNGVDHELAQVEKDPSFLPLFQKVHGIDLSKQKILLSIGRAVKRKGFSWFVKSVLPQLPEDVCYLIVGPTHSPNSIVHHILTFLPKKVRHQVELFLGYPSDSVNLHQAIRNSKRKALHMGQLPWSELQQLMAHADLMIMPNQKVEGDMEGFGLVALESGLLGTYVVASDMEGITSAVSSDNIGTLLPAMDIKGWIDAITTLMHDDDRLSAKGEKGREYIIEEYGWDKMSEQYFRAFDKTSREESSLLPSIRGLTMST